VDAQGVKPRLSIIVPVLNEEDGIEAALLALSPMRARGCNIIVADGGSNDGTVVRAAPHCDAVVNAPRGRATQMNAGAARASGDVLLFLHSDTRLPDGADDHIVSGLEQSKAEWGRFDVRILGRSPVLPLVAAMMNARSRLTGICTGDQAIFIRADAFHAAGGFPEIALMEDIAFSKNMKRRGRPLCLRERVATSGRRWESHGVIRTVLLMWRLRAAYFFGDDPAKLAARYGYKPREP
jgi:rSAM/selenodomain-associated transferase 2